MEPLAKRPRLLAAPSLNNDENEDELVQERREINSRRDPDMKLERGRAMAAFRLKSTFESIFEKYEHELEGDEIDLATGEIVINTGHVESLKDPNRGSQDGSDDEEQHILRGSDTTKSLAKASRPESLIAPSPLWPARPSHPSPWNTGPPFPFDMNRIGMGMGPMPVVDSAWQAPDLPVPNFGQGFGYGFRGFGAHSLGRGTHWGNDGMPLYRMGSQEQDQFGQMGSVKLAARKTIQPPAMDEADDEDDILLGPQPSLEAKVNGDTRACQPENKYVDTGSSSRCGSRCGSGPGSDTDDGEILRGTTALSSFVELASTCTSGESNTNTRETRCAGREKSSHTTANIKKKTEGKEATPPKDLPPNHLQSTGVRKRKRSISNQTNQAVTTNLVGASSVPSSVANAAKPSLFVVELIERPQSYLDQFTAVPPSPPSKTHSDSQLEAAPDIPTHTPLAPVQSSGTPSRMTRLSAKCLEDTLQISPPAEKPVAVASRNGSPVGPSNELLTWVNIKDTIALALAKNAESMSLEQTSAAGNGIEGKEGQTAPGPEQLQRTILDPSYEFSDEDEPLPQEPPKILPSLSAISMPLDPRKESSQPPSIEHPIKPSPCTMPEPTPNCTATPSLPDQLDSSLAEVVNDLHIVNDEVMQHPTGTRKSKLPAATRAGLIAQRQESSMLILSQSRLQEEGPAPAIENTQPETPPRKSSRSRSTTSKSVGMENEMAAPLDTLTTNKQKTLRKLPMPSSPPTIDVASNPVSAQDIYDMPHSSPPPVASDDSEQSLPQLQAPVESSRHHPSKPQTPVPQMISSLGSHPERNRSDEDELSLPSSDMFTAFSSGGQRRMGSFDIPPGTNSPRRKSQRPMGYLRDGSSPSVQMQRSRTRRGSSPIKPSAGSASKMLGRRDRDLREKVLRSPKKYASPDKIRGGIMGGSGQRSGSPTPTLVQTPGGTRRRCGEGGWICGRDWCFTCLR